MQDGAILSRLPKMVVPHAEICAGLSGHWQSYRDGGAALLPGKLLSD